MTLSRGPKQTCRMAIRELNVHRGWFTADSPHLVPPRGAASACRAARSLLVLTPTLPRTLDTAPVPYASLTHKPYGSQPPPLQPLSRVQQGRGSRGREREKMRESHRTRGRCTSRTHDGSLTPIKGDLYARALLMVREVGWIFPLRSIWHCLAFLAQDDRVIRWILE